MAQTAINTGEVSIDGTIPISGTVTANQGASGASAWPVDASGHTVPVSAASLPLPSNAAEETGGNLASLATHQTDGNQKTQVTNFPALNADNITEWGSAVVSAATNDSPTGSETAPVIRPIARKRTIIETTTTLGANATFTGSWHDSELDGTRYVCISSLSNVIAAASGLKIQGTDDQGNAGLTKTFFLFQPTAGVNFDSSGLVAIQIRTRYYRVTYTNGATPQGSFELALTCFDDTQLPVSSGALSSSQPTLPTALGGGSVSISDNITAWELSAGSGNVPLVTDVLMYGGAFSGTTDAARRGYSAARTPTVFRQTSTTSSGATTLWTPATGNKFRLLRFKIQITSDATLSVAGDLTLSLLDNASDIALSHIVFVPSTATPNIAGDYDSGWIDLGTFGILSAAVNNPLKINLSSALTAGKVNVIVCGTEE